MADPRAARLNQLRNIQARTGKSIAELHALLAASGMARTSECRALLMKRFHLGYGDANAVALLLGKPLPALDRAAAPTQPTEPDDALDAIYSGAKAPLRLLHEAVMARVRGLGSFEVAPKQSYISLRRRKQFAMLGPATRNTIDIGLNHRALTPSTRLKPMPPGGMCQYKVRISAPDEIDAELVSWLEAAFENAA